MLKIGTQGIAAMRLGAQEIQKAYLGDALVFGAAKPSRLPEGYTEVEYIQSSGGACIDTKQKPSSTFKLTMDVEHLSIGSKYERYFFYSFYQQSTSSRFHCRAQISTANKIVGLIGNYNTAPLLAINNDGAPRRMTVGVDYPLKSIFADNESTKFSTNSYNATTNTNMTTVKLLNSSITSSTSGLDAKLYSCQIYKSSTLICDFVPCIDPTGAVGLCDLVGGEFYGNSGTGTLTAGPAV